MSTSERKVKPPKIFISHASEDSDYIELFVDLLELIGIRGDQLFCSSVSGYDIPEGENIYDYLKEQFKEFDLHMFYMLSKNYYNSAAALNEMGAGWVLEEKYTTILLPGYEYKEIKGAVNPNIISASFDEEYFDLENHLSQIKAELEQEFDLKPLPPVRWEVKVREFIEKIQNLKSRQAIKEEEITKINRQPKLLVSINEVMPYKEIKNFSENSIRAEYYPLSMSDVLESGVKVSQAELDKYNNSLPSEEEIERYIKEYKEYLLKTTEYSDISICVENDGTCKANDIHISLKFPEEIYVLEKEEISQIKEPKAPEKPRNPIDDAYLKSFLGKMEMMNNFGIDPEVLDVISNDVIHDAVRALSSINAEVDLDENSIEISLSTLQHTRKETYGEFAIAAVKKGKYEIECTIMCDEYAEPEVQYIFIDVV